MTRRMLINAQSQEELRIAIVENSTLQNYQIQVSDRSLSRGNIYRGTIVSIQPSLNAAFIDYGGERHGFLAIQDVVPEAYYRQPKEKGKRPRIDEVLERGKPIVVQVAREAEGEKGAVLSTNLSLAGRYLVLTPFASGLGISRKVEDEETRKRLKSHVKNLEIPEGFGVIVRTNALDQNKTSLSRDLAALLRQWKKIETEARRGKGVKLLYDDQDLIMQALRDWLDSSIAEVLVDDDDTLARAEEHKKALMPRSKIKLVRYADRTPLFAKYDLEPQIERIYDRRVDLPSGGSIVIDRTEALTAIDVNSGRSTGASSQEETAVATNVEAATEVARQLRLRDIGGLLVVDFIDMRSSKNRRKIEKALKGAMKDDRARFTVNRISSNGLVEINRQRIQQALTLRTHRPCPTCSGTGRIASPEMVGLNLMRKMEARAASGTLQRVRIGLHPELADAFQNGRRREIAKLEEEFGIRVEVIAASHLHRPDQEIEWIEGAGDGEGSGRSEKESSRAGSDDASSGSRGRRKSRKRSDGGSGGSGSSKAKDDTKPSGGRAKGGGGRTRRASGGEGEGGPEAGGPDVAGEPSSESRDERSQGGGGRKSGGGRRSRRSEQGEQGEQAAGSGRKSGRSGSGGKGSAEGGDGGDGGNGGGSEGKGGKDDDGSGSGAPRRRRRRRGGRGRSSGKSSGGSGGA